MDDQSKDQGPTTVNDPYALINLDYVEFPVLFEGGISIPNPSRGLRIYLDHIYFNVGEVEVFNSHSEVIFKKKFGLEVEGSPAHYPAIGYEFDIVPNQLKGVEKLFFKLEVRSRYSVTAPITVKPMDEKDTLRSFFKYFVAGYIGLLLGLLIYHFFIFLIHGEKMYLYYCLILFCFHLFANLSQFGIVQVWMANLGAYWVNRLFHFTHYIGFVGCLPFILLYFAKIYNNRLLPNLGICLFTSNTIVLLFSFYSTSPYIDFYFQISTTVFSFYLLFYSATVALRGDRSALIFFFSWLLPITAWMLKHASIHGIGISQLTSSYLILGASSVEAILLSFGMANRLNELRLMQRRDNDRWQKAEIEKEKYIAIATSMQMLGHDIRKPFSISIGLMDRIEKSESFEQAKNTVKNYGPAIKNAVKRANGMIYDIMQISSESMDSNLELENRDLVDLIKRALYDQFAFVEGPERKFSYFFKHKTFVKVDVERMNRVFINILANANQAMGHHRKIWFRTKQINDEKQEFVEICIGNEGSVIPEENLNEVFEAFYTKDKKGGTGLGLAIVKKIVLAHGGEIYCSSNANIGVEFCLKIPAAHGKASQITSSLPSSSKSLENPTTLW